MKGHLTVFGQNTSDKTYHFILKCFPEWMFMDSKRIKMLVSDINVLRSFSDGLEILPGMVHMDV